MPALNRPAVTPAFAPVDSFLQMTGIGKTKFYHHVAAGDFKVRKLGRRTLVDVAESMRFLNTLPDHTGPVPGSR